MRRRLLITGAGTGASNNLVRSLRGGDPSLRIVGVNSDRFVLKKSLADRRYLLPSAESDEFTAALLALVERERIALVIPTSDLEVSALSEAREALGPRCFLPDRAAIARCQDKHALTAHLAAHAIPIADTRPVTDVDALPDLFARLGGSPPFWCRARTGSRSLGAAPVRSPEQARAWMLYWEEMRGVPVTSFIVSEYLPGRDFLCQSLWKDGALLLVRLTASHFLWKMVRRVVGALVKVGAGELSVPDFRRLVDGQPIPGMKEGTAAWTAPPSGLFLAEVAYRGDPAEASVIRPVVPVAPEAAPARARATIAPGRPSRAATPGGARRRPPRR